MRTFRHESGCTQEETHVYLTVRDKTTANSMHRQEKVLSSGPEDGSLSLRTHTVGEEDQEVQMRKCASFLKERWQTWLNLGISGLATGSEEITE